MKHCQTPLAQHDTDERLLVLVASVTAALYPEDHEFRRRTRYAILAGLDAEGFEPTDSQHIGFYWPTADPTGHDPELPSFVPYEEFRRVPKSVTASKSEGSIPEHVLLVWFNEDILGSQPLRQLGNFLCKSLLADAPPISKVGVRFLGPESSSTLKNIITDSGWPASCPMRPEFYVYSATVDDATLIPDYLNSHPDCVACLENYFASRDDKLKVYRTTSTNHFLTLAIRSELKLRNGNYSPLST
jgi:hypothetical protein